jgi:3-hydroxybutyryl-CoA dehydrogenase
MVEKISVAGAGTMGSGIAQCAAQQGIQVILLDTNIAVLEKARGSIERSLQQLQQKGKLTETEATIIFQRITFTSTIEDAIAPLFIEAIVEKLDIKISLFSQVMAVNGPDAIYASNTSSLSIDALQAALPYPDRVAGLHFFNPATLMKLVEVVQGKQTDATIADQLVAFCKQLNKTPVRCSDAPGFIVNRVARHYYLEAMRMVEQGIATMETVDDLMESVGFRMGPFRLMDLIGNDINLAVSQSLYEAFEQEPRFQPSSLQIERVESGNLGRKTGQGFYAYS